MRLCLARYNNKFLHYSSMVNPKSFHKLFCTVNKRYLLVSREHIIKIGEFYILQAINYIHSYLHMSKYSESVIWKLPSYLNGSI